MPAKAPARTARATAAPAIATADLPPAPPPALISLPAPLGPWKFLALLLAFVAPAAGGLLALLYWGAPEGPARRFSRWCLVVAALGFLLSGATDAFHGGESLIQPY